MGFYPAERKNEIMNSAGTQNWKYAELKQVKKDKWLMFSLIRILVSNFEICMFNLECL